MIKLKKTAKRDLINIQSYWFSRSQSEKSAKTIRDALIAKCYWLDDNPFAGHQVEGSAYRVIYVAQGNRFGIYYRVRGKKTVVVLTIRDNRQPRPTVEELEEREANP